MIGKTTPLTPIRNALWDTAHSQTVPNIYKYIRIEYNNLHIQWTNGIEPFDLTRMDF